MLGNALDAATVIIVAAGVEEDETVGEGLTLGATGGNPLVKYKIK